MSKEQDKQLYETLTRTGRLLKGIEPVEGEEYTLESILAEFGQGGAKPAQNPEPLPVPAAPKSNAESESDPISPAPSAKRGKVLSFPAASQETAAPIPEPVPSVAKAPDRDPPDRVSLRDIMHDTVDSVLAEDEEDGILEPPASLRERIRTLFPGREKRPVTQDTEQLWEEPEREPEPEEEPEPDLDEAMRYERRRCKHLHRGALLGAFPCALLIAATALQEFEILPSIWLDTALIPCCVLGGLLLLTNLLCLDVCRTAITQIRSGRITCELACCLTSLVALGHCACAALTDSTQTPLAAPAAVLVWLCQWGLLQTANARRESLHLADMGGTPPYVISVTAAGACKQKGVMEGFYRTMDQPDPARRWQTYVLPLLISAATVLAGLVCLTKRSMEDFLFVWSAMLTVAVPPALPLTGTLPLARVTHRLTRSGCTVAGYRGARAVSRSRRLVLTENDIFPPGTVEFNGYKVYGEERLKVLSYAATVAHAARSQLDTLFEQQLASEGGFRQMIDDLHFYEEGGVGGTIHGESVIMGSAFFMKKQKVVLPHDLKLKTGVFLAVDGVLVGIFVIKYQPSRNVEWALRALRRSHIQPVLAVRSGNVTPGLIRRKFGVDTKPIYPDVSTRLALSDVIGQTGELPAAILYREGLMPLAETVIGSKRLVSSVRSGTVLTYISAVIGLLLTYYLTSVGQFTVLNPFNMLVFLLLWLIPALLISGLVKHY